MIHVTDWASQFDSRSHRGALMTVPSPTAAPDGLLIEDSWGDFVAGRYREGKSEAEFRNYDATAVPTVAAFYKTNHELQTLDFVLSKEKQYFALDKGRMSIWEAAEFLNTLVDESDPDTDLTQIEHLLQTSEAIRKDGHPRWMVLTGFIHDLGKVLCLYGEPQWAVVGDTFPVGCAYSGKIVFPEYFAANPDSGVPEYQTECGIYEPNCGLSNIHMSWGHDTYIGHVVKNHMPEEALYMLRYHSFYAWHQQGAYRHLMSKHDEEMLPWVLKFNPYDLYSKGAAKPDLNAIKPYYEDLIAEFFPEKIDW
jgi:inositol oxygenase